MATCAIVVTLVQKKHVTENESAQLVPDLNIYYEKAEINAQACPTIGLGCGSRCSHDLSLLVMFLTA
jgi:hypothetical protein